MKDAKAITMKQAKAVQVVSVETLVPVRPRQLGAISALCAAGEIRTSPQAVSPI